MTPSKSRPTRPHRKPKGKPRTIGRAVHVRKPKVKRQHSKMEDSVFFDDVESYSDQDARVAKEIDERRREERKEGEE